MKTLCLLGLVVLLLILAGMCYLALTTEQALERIGEAIANAVFVSPAR